MAEERGLSVDMVRYEEEKKKAIVRQSSNILSNLP